MQQAMMKPKLLIVLGIFLGLAFFAYKVVARGDESVIGTLTYDPVTVKAYSVTDRPGETEYFLDASNRSSKVVAARCTILFKVKNADGSVSHNHEFQKLDPLNPGTRQIKYGKKMIERLEELRIIHR